MSQTNLCSPNLKDAVSVTATQTFGLVLNLEQSASKLKALMY